MKTEVFFVTNRKMIIEDNQNQQFINFGEEINNETSSLYFGKAKVSNNKEKVSNNKEEVNTSRVTNSTELCCSQDILEEVREHMVKGIDTIILFHGFKNTFNDAIIGAAELKDLYENKGDCDYTIIVFSWPSDGNSLSYFRDRNDARNSGEIFGSGLYQMAQFLTKICQIKGNKKIVSDNIENEILEEQNNKTNFGCLHIIAHSMGNYALRHTLQKFYEIYKEDEDQTPEIFDETILIAADEDGDSFEHEYKLNFLPSLTKRLSVYFNQKDIALKMSDWLRDNIHLLAMNINLLNWGQLLLYQLFKKDNDNTYRLGSQGPSQLHNIPNNVFLINCEDVVSGFLKHDYHKTAQAVCRDISYTLTGWSSEDILERGGRTYDSETNSYDLVEEETTTQTDIYLSQTGYPAR